MNNTQNNIGDGVNINSNKLLLVMYTIHCSKEIQEKEEHNHLSVIKTKEEEQEIFQEEG